MKLQLEFVFRRNVPWLTLVFCAASMCCAAFAGAQWWVLHAKQMRLQESVAKLEQQLQERQREASKSTEISTADALRLKDEQKIRAVLAYPWNRVLAEIEQVEVNDVAILSLAHEQGGGGTRLTVEALDASALIRYVDALNDDTEENHWYLSSYQSQPQNTPPTVLGTILNK